eukprot:6069093-Lingulodinium_polyedra.AAC.1
MGGDAFLINFFIFWASDLVTRSCPHPVSINHIFTIEAGVPGDASAKIPPFLASRSARRRS